MIFAHAGQPAGPHELATAWSIDPLVLPGLLLLAWTYRRGGTLRPQRPVDRWRARSFAGGLVVVGIALLSPLDAASDSLASAHMVQHLLLTLVAAPLLAYSAPSSALLRGSPALLRSGISRWRRRLRLTGVRLLRRPVPVLLLYIGTLWTWHAAAAYGAALDNEVVHVLQHTTFLFTGVLLWRLLLDTRGPFRMSRGLGVLLVFGTALGTVMLSLLLTFAQSPWYAGYATTTQAWGLEPLADQRLAGVIMWVPAGLVYVVTALTLFVTWVRATELTSPPSTVRPIADLPTQIPAGAPSPPCATEAPVRPPAIDGRPSD